MDKREPLSTLKGSLDSNDSLLTNGHRVMKTAGATRNAERMTRVPAWAIDDQKIKQLINSRFPKASTDQKQRSLAARMVRVLYLYYRAGETRQAVAEQVGMTAKAVKQLIERLNKSMSKPLNPAHRPKKGGPIDGSSGVIF